MATIRIVALRDKIDEAGTVPLYLQVSVGGRRRRLSLSQRIPERHWNGRTGKVRSSYKASEEINGLLADMRSHAQAALVKLKGSRYPVTAARLKSFIETALAEDEIAQDDFFSYYEQQIAIYEQRRQYGTAKRHGSALSRLREFCMYNQTGKQLQFDQIDPAFLRAFDSYLVGTLDLKQSSSNNHVKAMRTIYYRALREGIVKGDNPFFHMTLKKEERASLVALTLDELERLTNLSKLPEGDREIVDIFAFATYALGMRVSDAVLLNWSEVEGGRLNYTMRKNGKTVNVKLPTKAGKIVERYRGVSGAEYVWPSTSRYNTRTEKQKLRVISTRAAYFNKRLKILAEKADIDKRLTMHVARHTFSKQALDSGWSLRKLQNALRHSSIRTTEKYAGQLTTSDLDEDVVDLF